MAYLRGTTGDIKFANFALQNFGINVYFILCGLFEFLEFRIHQLLIVIHQLLIVIIHFIKLLPFLQPLLRLLQPE